MNAAQPQWKTLPDSPGIWVLERESELAALLGAKYAILEIKQCSLDRPTSSKYCVRAYGPIPTETAAAQIIRPEPTQEIQPMPQFSPHDLQQLQIDQLIRDVKELNQRSIRSDIAHSAAITQEKQTRIANDTAQVDFVNNLAARLDMHAQDIVELTVDTKEADKKILANSGAIARIVRHLERLPERQEKPAPDITEPTATEWDTNPEKMLGQINAELNRPPNAEVKPEDFW